MNRRHHMNLVLEAIFGKDYPLLKQRIATEKRLIELTAQARKERLGENSDGEEL